MKTVYALLGACAFAASLHAQAPQPAAPPSAPAAPPTTPAAASAPVREIVLTATSANVKGSGVPVSIRLFRWSTDEERTPLIAAFNAPPPGAGRRGAGAGAPAAGQQGQRGQGQGGQDQGVQDQGGQRQGGQGQARGQAPPAPADAQDQDNDADPDDDAPQGRGQGQPAQGRGQGQGQGQAQGQAPGRGRGAVAPASPTNPMTQALQKAPTIGYLWTNEPTGYSVKQAWRTPQPDGSERIVVITEPRLGAYSPAWSLTTGTPTDYAFTLLEFRLNAKGGEGKSSLTSKVVADANTKQLALENYAAAPTILTNVKLTTK